MAAESTSATQAILDSITCPITSMPMIDPVQGNDGHTYERAAIEKWLTEKKELSPMTNQTMKLSDLKVNAGIRYLCDEYHKGKFEDKPSMTKINSVDDSKYIIQRNSSHYDPDENLFFISLGVETLTPTKYNLDNAPAKDIVLVIDRSGSTSVAVSAQDENGKNIEAGLSINDILNHAAKTVASSLRPCDRLSVIAFDDRVEVVTSLQKMSTVNKVATSARIEIIKPGGTTNLYGGITTALNELNEREDKSNLSAIIALTDGQPNVSPSRGEVLTLQRLRDTSNFSTPIYMMGFGYHLKKGLLYDMARITNGSTGHIPDGGMVGTVFSNFLAMIMTTACNNLQIHIKFDKDNGSNTWLEDCGDHFRIFGDYPFQQKSNEYYIFDIGSVQFQQSRDIVFEIPRNIEFSYYFTYKIGNSVFTTDKYSFMDTSPYIQECEKNIGRHLRYQRARCLISEKMRLVIDYSKDNNYHLIPTVYEEMINLCENLECKEGKALSETLKDQVYLILGSQETKHKNYFNRWGEFYLDQLSGALLRQFTPNFKDEACKVFGGKLFDDFVDHIADTFDSLPPPKPSLKTSSYSTTRGASSSPIPITTMNVYNNAYGGCWTGNSTVLMSNGRVKLAKNIKPGDKIATIIKNTWSHPEYSSTTVKYTVKTLYKQGNISLIDLGNNSWITPWHPVLMEDDFYVGSKNTFSWRFPIHFSSKVIDANCESFNSLYNLILEDDHVAIVGGKPCITLGHGFKEGILEHPYFGTNKVIDDLIQYEENNEITIESSWIVKKGPNLKYNGFNTVSSIQKPNLSNSIEL